MMPDSSLNTTLVLNAATLLWFVVVIASAWQISGMVHLDFQRNDHASIDSSRSSRNSFVLVGVLGIPELLRDILVLHFVDGTVLLILTVFNPRVLAFLAWQFSLSVQRYIVLFVLKAEQTLNTTWNISLTTQANVASSILISWIYTFVLHNIDGNVGRLVATIIPILYCIVGCSLSLFAHVRLLGKRPWLLKALLMFTYISSIRLYQRGTLVTNIAMILVFGFFTGIEETMALSLSGLVISFALLMLLQVQQMQVQQQSSIEMSEKPDRTNEHGSRVQPLDPINLHLRV